MYDEEENFGWQNDNEANNQQQLKERSSESLATASLVLGIISLFSVFCCCPFVVSAVGITLALVSKGASHMLKPRAKTGLILSIAGLVVSFAVVIGTVVMPVVLAKLNPEIGEAFKQQYREVLEQNEEYYRDMYGDETYEQIEDIIDRF